MAYRQTPSEFNVGYGRGVPCYLYSMYCLVNPLQEPSKLNLRFDHFTHLVELKSSASSMLTTSHA
ncbi:hypothetical protein HOLleu_04588 [Holothuria leucospilota]|uniref:Uncharacterized protein n=1 Tax=Holothuria leucospilota TaxID=206669 RepID=A0A9Q1HLY5_HOLLE|nr:hypothetical protein HOLleu_04588 [Holothuria leucospilota]